MLVVVSLLWFCVGACCCFLLYDVIEKVRDRDVRRGGGGRCGDLGDEVGKAGCEGFANTRHAGSDTLPVICCRVRISGEVVEVASDVGILYYDPCLGCWEYFQAYDSYQYFRRINKRAGGIDGGGDEEWEHPAPAPVVCGDGCGLIV